MWEGHSRGPSGSERHGRVPSGSEPDDSELPGVPDQRTLALINIYLVHTTKMLNTFATTCEQKLHVIHSRILEMDTKLQLLEAKVSSAAASMDAASPPAIEGSDLPAGPSSSSQPQPHAEGGGGRVGNDNPVSPSRIDIPESVAPSVHGDSDSVEEIDLGFSSRPHNGSRAGPSERAPRERIEEYITSQRRDALSRRPESSGSLPEDLRPIQLPPLAKFPGLNMSPAMSTDFQSSNGSRLGSRS